VNDLYKENYKPLKKEIEEDYRRWNMDWQNQPSKIGYITKSNLHVQFNSHKIPMIFITEIEKSALKFYVLETQNS
jgi:hypothetical protein